MNILVIIPKTFAGCGFYRMYQPHNHLAKNYDVKVTLASSFMKSRISAYTDDELRAFDFVIWHKTLFDLKDIKRAKDLGVVTIADFDDYWAVPREHSLYKQYNSEGQVSKLHKLLLAVDYVTCTTADLADEIYKVNQNVQVLPNAYDLGYDGWKRGRVKEDPFVFGYLGGPCHVRDVGLLRGVRDATGAHFRLFGWNGTDIYNHYADILSGGGPNDDFSLFRGADIWNYPQFYNYMDVSLVPLEDSKFNGLKSELKLVEAGAFKKAVIVSPVKPYTNVIRSGKNCLTAGSKAEWIGAVKKLKGNSSLAQDLGEQLHRDTLRYDINSVNKTRYKFYKDVHKKHNSNRSAEPGRVVRFDKLAV